MRLPLKSAAMLGALLLAGAPRAGAAEMPVLDYVGTERCADCHAAEAEAWAGSDHDLAWTPPTAEHVLGDFDDATFSHDGTETAFRHEGQHFLIETEDGSGIRRTFPVVGVAGIRPLQQYLLEPEPGRTQSFDVVWDVERQVWYDLYPDDDIKPGDGLHWTGPYKSWEARCAECHATGFNRNYEAETDRYVPELAEIGVGCEACHGPGAAHVAWVEEGGAEDATGYGLTVDLAASAEAEVQQCAGCHSRRESFFDGNPLPGTPFHDSYALALLRGGLYHPDGQIEDEVYVYGSFLQSKMYANGVRCSDCHEPHATSLRAEGNDVCSQCHSPAGNSRFPALEPALYDDPSHHFHEPGTPGAQCRNCHMPERFYMVTDGRRDHSFRIPRPDLAETGSPDACTDCHTDRTPAWAEQEIAARFPEPLHRGPHFATAFAAARWDAAAQSDALAEIAADPALSGIVRATALDLLGPVATPELAAETAALLTDPDPLVRAAAPNLQRPLPPVDRLAVLAPALGDPLRAVRVAAAKAMLGPPASGAPASGLKQLANARGEWQAALFARRDFPETHLQIGGAALAERNVEAAVRAFEEAAAMDPQLVDAWAMVARIRAAVGDPAGARRALEAGLAVNPGDGYLTSLMAELGP